MVRLTEEQLLALQTKQAKPQQLLLRKYPTEEEEHLALFAWVRLHEGTYPDLRWLYHIPNGEHRHIAVGKKLKAMGVRPGIFDFFLPCPRLPFHGLYLELKSKTGTPTTDQLNFYRYARRQGYQALFCYSFGSARDALIQYLSLRNP